MELLKFALVAAIMVANLGLIRSSCLTKWQSFGSNDVNVGSLSNALLKYTLNQYKEMVGDAEYEGENIVSSPYSSWSALALTYLGARQSSSHVLGYVLGLDGMNKTKVEKKMNELSTKVSSSVGSIFTVANKIAIDQKIRVKDCVVNDASLNVEKVNFAQHPEQERENLNNWVEGKTNNLIKDLLPEGSISPATVMTILNAVYFKGSWKKEFSKRDTKKATFTSANGVESEVRMMYKRDYLSHGLSDDGVFVDIPYDEGKFSMIVTMPSSKHKDIDSFVTNLTPAKVQTMLDNKYTFPVYLGLPRFEMTKSYGLKEVLSKMGAESIFRSINLSGIVDGSPPLYVSNVFHKTFIKVEEKGTEAAGASAVVVNTRVGMSENEVVFNKPFVFMLRERSTNAILFMGVVRNL